MSERQDGKVVTFYSYKGGTGRTMALANVAWILAANGKRVLVVDWDLESPGLHRYFAPFIGREAVLTQTGIIELIKQFQLDKARELRGEMQLDVEVCADVTSVVLPIDWDQFPAGGRLDFLSA